jgi:hypothetical protein
VAVDNILIGQIFPILGQLLMFLVEYISFSYVESLNVAISYTFNFLAFAGLRNLNSIMYVFQGLISFKIHILSEITQKVYHSSTCPGCLPLAQVATYRAKLG